MSQENNYAYIDGANLHRGNASLGWNLDYKKFRVWLSDKYSIKTAYLFLGMVPMEILMVRRILWWMWLVETFWMVIQISW